MSLDKPIIELVEEYISSTNNPEERELLTNIFDDTRKEYEEYLEERRKYEENGTLKYNFPTNNLLSYNLKLTKPISVEDLEKSLADNYGLRSSFYVDQQALSYIRFDGFIEHKQFLGFHYTLGDSYTRSELIQTLRKGEFILHNILRSFLSENGHNCPEIERLISYRAEFLTFIKRLPNENLFNKLEEENSFETLKKRCRHYCNSKIRDLYFEKLLRLAKTKEEIFFVVKHGSKCPCWPKAVRRLAHTKDLSPIEKIK